MKIVKKNCVVTCPYCGYKKEEEMPLDACRYFYTCTNCGNVIKPKEGDCCVFCSYGNFPCLAISIGARLAVSGLTKRLAPLGAVDSSALQLG